MTAEKIRSQNDLTLCAELLENRDVKKVNDYIAREEDKGPGGLRRRLLATSVRLSRRMAPDVHTMADECIEKLDMKIPLELYVFASPQYNAMCFKPEDGRLFVMFASSLLEAFNDSELRFVLGHELGHHVYRHHDVPIGYLLNGNQRPNPKLALELFAWSRYAEISADRAGAWCARDLDGVARALFKLASGLSDKLIRFSLDDFLQQVDEMQIEDAQPGQGAPKEDWFSTHPFSPLRVKALQHFHQSELMTDNGNSKADLEVAVQGLMSLMEPNYIEGRTDTAEAMRRLLFAGAIDIADASGGISDKEIAVFERFFGKGGFDQDFDLKRIKSELDNRIKLANEQTSTTQRMQVLRDLCLMARADGRVHKAERDALYRIATGLEVSTSFVNQTLDGTTELD